MTERAVAVSGGQWSGSTAKNNGGGTIGEPDMAPGLSVSDRAGQSRALSPLRVR